MNYEFSSTLVNLKITSLERVSENKESVKLGPSNMDYSESAKNLDLGVYWAQAPYAMGKFACHLGHFFAILKSPFCKSNKVHNPCCFAEWNHTALQ